MLIVAHRLSSVRRCDRLVFLSNGRVKACGSYDELLRDDAEFRRLATVQGRVDKDPTDPRNEARPVRSILAEAARRRQRRGGLDAPGAQGHLSGHFADLGKARPRKRQSLLRDDTAAHGFRSRFRFTLVPRRYIAAADTRGDGEVPLLVLAMPADGAAL